MKKKRLTCVVYLLSLLFLINILGPIDLTSFQVEKTRDNDLKISASAFNILTPKNKLYRSPMSGYYPSTYGFEEDSVGTSGEEITFIDDWTEWGDVVIVDELDRHKNILSCTQTGAGEDTIRYFFGTSINSGTIEFWYRTPKLGGNIGEIRLRGSGGTGPYIVIDEVHFGYDAGGGFIILEPYNVHRWYHLKIEWFSNDTFDFYIDNELVLDGGAFYSTLFSGPNELLLKTGYASVQYFDAFGFSWDPEYTVGDNFEEGLLLNYETAIDLVWQGYSLDGQAPYTILGNHTIPMPNSGPHTIQVFGNDSIDNPYASTIRSFSVDYDYTRIAPIFIDDSDVNFNWSKTAAENAWCSGSGTVGDPYIIEYIIIDGSDYSNCVYIQNSNVSFIIRYAILYCSYYYLYYDMIFVRLNNVSNGRIQSINCSYGESGIYLDQSNNNVILENNFNNINSEAIALDDSSHNNVAGNIINGEGIRVAWSKYNDFSENIIENGRNGFIIYGNCENTTLWKNIVTNNYKGIQLQGASHLIISENIITNSRTSGIAIYTVLNCDFLDNYIANCTRGIVIGAGSYYNNFTLNEIRNNSDYGLTSETGNQNNSICNNKFIGNAIQALDSGINNYWNNSFIGNYWDDYEGYDLNGDFIGDDPYDIIGSASSRDHLPIWNWTGNDNIEPKITVNLPQSFNISGYDPPAFNIYVEEYSLEDVWYTLNNSLVKVFIFDNGTVDPSYWDTIDHGQIPLTFFANDTSGNYGSMEVLIYKDIIAPNITILGPHPDYWKIYIDDTYPSYWSSNPPTFELLISEQCYHTWYTIDGGKQNFTFTGLKGTINQKAWRSMPDGEITITFYAEDLVGHIGYAEVTINKLFDVTDYYPIIILGVVGFLSILTIFIVLFRRRRRRKRLINL